MQRQVRGAIVTDELDIFEVLVREVRCTNVPTVEHRVCKQSALFIARRIWQARRGLARPIARGLVKLQQSLS